ncbi:MAG: DUF2322 family protein [Gallionellaceae bacterium]|nr:DUF2322 family protein [Gallionellaceae bacterium]MDD5364406.1 DUF2322 family protein [Gallionellaceae bacterium]
MSFAENLNLLPETGQLAAIKLTGPDGETGLIENIPGSQGSVRVYAWLLAKYGDLGRMAAAEGLELYAEHVADARAQPGKHPNIDRLLAIVVDGRPWGGSMT